MKVSFITESGIYNLIVRSVALKLPIVMSANRAKNFPPKITLYKYNTQFMIRDTLHVQRVILSWGRGLNLFIPLAPQPK